MSILRHNAIFRPNPQLGNLLLRVGLAVVFLYAAVSSTMSPREWLGYLPTFMTNIVDADILLKIFSFFELILAVLLLAGLYIRYVALIAALTLLAISIFNFDLFAISFRDIGLACMALALAISHIEASITQK